MPPLLRCHPFAAGEPITAVVALPDDALRPLLHAGALVFVVRPAVLHDRFLVLRSRATGRVLVRHVSAAAGELHLTGTADGYRLGEPGHLRLTVPQDWTRSGPLDLHPAVDVLGAAVVCGASYSALVGLLSGHAALAGAGLDVGPLGDDAARALYGPATARTGPAAVRATDPRRLPDLLTGSAN